MKINDRIKLLGDLVNDNAKVLDIGCDHAFLDIYLVKSNRGITPIASDIARGPVKLAKENIKKEDLEDKIEVRLGNGLDTCTDDIDTVVISGMGGRNMIGIFKNNMEKLKNIETIILSPNNYQIDVKKFLCRNGFYIANEKFVKEKYIYEVIVFKKGYRKYTRKQLYFGPVFLEEKSKLFYEYYLGELRNLQLLLVSLPLKYYLKRVDVKRQIRLIKNTL